MTLHTFKLDREDEISKVVGRNLKRIRMAMGMSQEKLGEKLGCTFQQVQKYEKGTNRIGAPKLLMVSEYTNRPLADFFEGAEVTAEEVPDKPGPHMTNALKMANTFAGLSTQHQAVVRAVMNTLKQQARNETPA